MDPDKDNRFDDEELVEHLIAQEEALARGEPLPMLSELATTPELAARLRGVRECLILLDQDCRQAACQTPRADATVEIEVDALPLPESIGRFRIIDELGRGAFGIVYLADDPRAHRLVALKVPRPEALFSQELRERFRREGLAAAQLDHPHLVTVYEVGETGPFSYLVSRYCTDGSLADFLHENRAPINPWTAARVVAQPGRRRGTLHARGMHHRDIKPSNILLEARLEKSSDPKTARGYQETSEKVAALEDMIVRLGDFGLVKVLSDAVGDTQGPLTKSQQILGTPQYMAPEQARGMGKHVGPAADQYALGVVLYELLVGRVPLKGDSDLETLQRVAMDDPVEVSALRPSVPRDLQTIVHKCLEKQPAKRYDKAGDLADDLHNFLEGRPIKGRRPSRSGRLLRWCRRNRALATSSAAAFLLLAGGIVGALFWVVDADLRRKEVEAAYNTSKLRIAENYLDRGISEADRGDVALGMSWMALAIQTAPANADAVLDAARANLNSWSQASFKLTHFGGAPREKILAFMSNPLRALVAVEKSNVIRQWDIESAQLVGMPLQHPPSVTVSALAVTRSGNFVATGCSDGRIRIWDMKTGQMQKELTENASICGLAFAPDGTSLVVGRHEFKNPTTTDFTKWNLVETRQAVLPIRLPERIVGVFYSADGAKLMIIPHQGRAIERWEISTGRYFGSILQHQGNILAAACSSDGRMILTGGEDRTARLWDISSGRQLQVLYHRQTVGAVGFGPDEHTLLTGSAGGVQTWTGAVSPTPLQIIQLPEPVRVIEQSPNGKMVITGSDDAQARIWSVGPKSLEFGWKLPHPAPLACAAFRADSSQVAISMHQVSDVFLWDLDQRRIFTRLPHGKAVRKVVYSPDGDMLATASYDFSARVWSSRSRLPLPIRNLRHQGPVMSLAFSPDGKELLSGGDDMRVRLWNVSTGDLQKETASLGSTIASVVYSPDGNLALSGSDDGIVRRWNSRDLKLLLPELIHGDKVRTISFSANGRLILTGSWDNTARIWETATGLGRGIALRHHGLVLSAEFSASGAYVVTASDDGTARLWDAGTGRSLGPPLPHLDKVLVARFDRDVRWIATSGLDATLRLWPPPRRLDGTPALLTRWVQLMTGISLDTGESVQVLDQNTWQQHRQLVHEPGVIL